VTIELVGSTAKDTYLKDDLDIDFFLKFPTKYSKDIIAKNALIIGKSILSKTEESYAEHPYIRGYYQKYFVEVVPCYKIESASQKMSAVDRTPYHTRYVIDNLDELQKMEVRLFKQFLKGINCYGAESEIEGFSGYLCEILIIKYQTFKKLIYKAKNWKEGKKLSLTDEVTPDFDTPLVFIDPVDINRNVASALSLEKFNLFVRAANEYLKNPKITFFFPNKIKPWPLEKISKKIDKQNYKYIGIKIDKPDIIDENLYPQARKASKSIWDSSKRTGFTIYDIRFYIDEGKKDIYFIIKTKDEILPTTFIHTGPPKKLIDHIQEFLKKWEHDPRVIKKPYEKNGRYFVELKREYTDISVFLNDQIKNLSLGKHLII
jgi:tRNA nucleotidyltransferase (CCA-adding enzyme)